MIVTKSQRGELGARRSKHRYRYRELLDAIGHNSTTVARELGVSPVTVNRTINGDLHSPRVLDWFRKKGLAEKYLCDPRKGWKEAA